MQLNVLVLVALLVVALLALPGRRHWLRIGLVVLLVCVAAGLHSSARYRRIATTERARALACTAEAEAAALLAPYPPNICTDTPPAPELDAELRAAVGVPAHYEGLKIVVGSHVALFSADASAGALPAPGMPPSRQDTMALRTAVRHGIAEKLAAYFNRLVAQAPQAPGLHDLRDVLAPLSAHERRVLAARAAQLPEITLNDALAVTIDPQAGLQRHYALEVEIAPERVQSLVLGTSTPPQTLGTGLRFVIIIATVIAAAWVLKVTTKRTTGQRSAATLEMHIPGSTTPTGRPGSHGA